MDVAEGNENNTRMDVAPHWWKENKEKEEEGKEDNKAIVGR